MESRLKVLIVDDFAFARELLRRAVEKLSCDVSEAATGAAALKILETGALTGNPFDLTICDYNMPGMTGLDVFASCRNNPKLSSVHFVLITAQGDDSLIVKALKLGVVDCLRKPLPNNDMASRLEDIVRKVQAAPRSGQSKV